MGPWPCRPVRGIGAGRRHLAGPARLDDLISRKNGTGWQARCRRSPVRPTGHEVLILSSGPPACVCRSEEHTSELQSLMRISYAVFSLKKKNNTLLII